MVDMVFALDPKHARSIASRVPQRQIFSPPATWLKKVRTSMRKKRKKSMSKGAMALCVVFNCPQHDFPIEI